MALKIKFYKNVPQELANEGKNLSGVVVDNGSVIFATDNKIYLKDANGITIYGVDQMPQAYKNYLDALLKAQATAKLSASLSLSPSSYLVDQAPASGTATLRVSFDGKAVDATISNANFTKSSVGVYTYTMTKALLDSGCGDVTVTYTVPDGDYEGLTVSKTVSSIKASIIYPVFYGMVTAKTPSTIDVATLTRSNSGVSNADFEWVNTNSEAAYGVIITRGTASATQAGIPIISNQGTNSIVINGTTVAGYKFYFTDKSVAANGSLLKVNFKITQ